MGCRGGRLGCASYLVRGLCPRWGGYARLRLVFFKHRGHRFTQRRYAWARILTDWLRRYRVSPTGHARLRLVFFNHRGHRVTQRRFAIARMSADFPASNSPSPPGPLSKGRGGGPVVSIESTEMSYSYAPCGWVTPPPLGRGRGRGEFGCWAMI